MENPTEFDLNRQILAWREHLGLSPAFQRENLEELETHLRDSIATLQARGISSREAFIIATRRVGADGSLAAEYGKVNRQSVWLQRILWMLVGLQLWNLTDSILATLARTISTLVLGQWLRNQWLQGGTSRHVVMGTSIYAFTQLLAIIGSLAICWWLVVHQWPRLSRWAGHWFQGYRFLILAGLLLGAFAGQCMLPGLSSMLIFKTLPEGTFSDVIQSQGHWGYVVVFAGHAVLLLMATLWLARRRIGLLPDSCDLVMPADHNHMADTDRSGEMSAMIAGLTASGLSATEALIVAQHRTNGETSAAHSSGPDQVWATGWERAFWMLLGLQLWSLTHLNMRVFTGRIANFAMTAASHLPNRDQTSPVFNVAIPVVAFGLVQLLSLGGSLALCWWLTLRRGPQIAAWLNRLRQHRNWLAGVVMVILVLLAEIWLPCLWPVFNPLVPSLHAPPLQMEFFSAAYILDALGHSATLLILTFVLARKQFKFGRPA